ncbi:hypothetical protein V1512DRAFT_122942 [Lipomyces arxii]|uniref:uncharacterized protein n=1 Tax=Lipomyces arxii TaxID=56418 RepID=UPI0034CDA789
MSSDLFYSFMRIITAQILRGSGIDRCAPSVLDTVTDFTLRYFNLLVTKAIEHAALCGRREPDIGDIRIAMEAVGELRPMRILDEVVDGEWDEETPDPGLQRFIQWCQDSAADAKKITGGEELVDGLMKKQTKVNQEDRFKGTILDPISTDEEQHIKVDGGPHPESLQPA